MSNISSATTHRPNELKGTIAIDKETAGKSIKDIIEPLIIKYSEDGFIFTGLKIYIGHPHLLL